MREIGFRGKDAMGRKGWVYGDLVHNQKVTATGLEPRVMVGGYEVFPYSVGEYTGLTDKNGVKIYEGDIVVRRDLTFNIERTCVVVYNNEIASFRLHYQNEVYTVRYDFISSDIYNDGKCTIESKYEYEVIGNIYDDKDLLTQKITLKWIYQVRLLRFCRR